MATAKNQISVCEKQMAIRRGQTAVWLRQPEVS